MSWNEKDYIHNKDVFHMDYCTILHEKLEGLYWKNFIKMLFSVSDCFATVERTRSGKVAALEEYEMEFDCDNESFRVTSNMRRGHAHYPKMYPCCKATKAFFYSFDSYDEFEKKYDNLCFFKNRKVIFYSITHEGLHDLDFRGTNLSLDESIKKFDLSECIYLY